MAGSADRLVLSRRPRREIEEGEGVSGSGYYTGSDTDTDDEDARYYLRPVHRHDDRHGMMTTVARPGPSLIPLLEDVVGGSGSAGSRSRRSRRSRSTTRASSSLRSDGTTTDADAGGDAAAVTALFPACPVCHRQFHSSKAVHGHMRVHAQAQPKKEQKVSLEVGAVDEVGDSVSVSMAIDVVEETKVSDDPMPVEVVTRTSDQIVPGSGSGSGSSASVESSLRRAADLSMAILVAEAAPPAAAPKKIDIAPTPPAPEHKEVPVAAPAAPAPEPAAIYLHPPAPAQQHVAVAPPQAFHGPLQIIQHHAPRGFSCKECYRWFETHHGLGGHVAGHKNRRIAAAAAAAIAAGLDPIDHSAGGPRPERPHTCKVCGAVYTSGFRLGGHMRKHYTGKPIVPRKRARLLFPPDVIGLAIPGPAPAMEAAVVAPAAKVVAQPPQAPAVPAGCLRIFGVTIVQQAKKEEEEEPQLPVDDKQ